MTTETDICNMALDILIERPIGSIDDDRPIARWMRRNFYQRRDSLLSTWDWNFAIRRASIPRFEARPEWGGRYAYPLPTDCIRVLPITYDGRKNGRSLDYTIEEGVIMTDYGGPLRIRYISSSRAYDDYSPAFIDALAAEIATYCAHWLTGKTGFQSVAQALYDKAMSRAWATDAIEGTVDQAEDSSWLDARQGEVYWTDRI